MRLTRRRYAFNTMQVRVFPFGILRESLGSDAFVVELAGDATVAELLTRIGARNPAVQLRGIAVSVNAEYANPSQVLRNEDEVGLLPPVSGGCAGKSDAPTEADTSMATALTREPIDAENWLPRRSVARTARLLFLMGSSAIIRGDGKRCIWTMRPTKRWP